MAAASPTASPASRSTETIPGARTVRDGDVAVIELHNPPVNALGHALRAALDTEVQVALADASVKAIVLIGAGRMFCGGAELREFNTPFAAMPPLSHEIRARFEGADKPVVAAIHGYALGGGLELALGCHYRIGTRDARFALPEVQRGLLPGGGGTQRLPRLVGVTQAVTMITEGEPINAAKALASGLIDRIAQGELRDDAVRFAREMAARGGPLPVVSRRDAHIDDADAFFAKAEADIQRRFKGLDAPLACLACVRAATQLPFDEGLAFERARFAELVNGVQSKALRHTFFAERAAARIAGLPEGVKPRTIRKVGVLGAGTMGSGIAMCLASAGLQTVQLDTSQAALDKGRAAMARNWSSGVAKGRMTQAQADALLASVLPTLDYDDLRDCDMVIEAVFEDLAVKKEVFAKLDAVCKPGAILASNTSRLSIDLIAEATRRQADVIGLHFFSPANVMRLLEVVRGSQTAPDVIATAMDFGRAIGKLAVLVGNCDGFVGNRMLSPYSREALFLVEEGATPQQVDQALTGFGMKMGSFAVSDLAGLDIGWATRKRLAATRPQHLRYAGGVADRLCELGRFGQKTGAGWYRYEAGDRTPRPDPLVEQTLRSYAAQAGIAQRAVSDEEIVERMMFALVNEGAWILQEGLAQRASDIDLVYVNGYGFPAHRGGPMFHADTVGLAKVAERIQALHAERGDHWKPAPLLLQLAAEGRTFNT